MDEQYDELQKTELQQLNERAIIYGEQSLTEQELQQFEDDMTAGNVEAGVAHRERIKKMMLLDSESASQLREFYPDLFNEVQTEKQHLENQANIDGLQKIKHDTFGRHKSAAKKELAKIREAEKKLGAYKRRKRAFDMVKEDVGYRLQERFAEQTEGKKQAEADKDYNAAKAYEEVIDAFYDAEIGKDSAAERLDAYALTSEYCIACKRVQEEFLSKKVVLKPDGSKVGYDADKYYRDTAWFCGSLDSIYKVNVDDMLSVADATYVMRYGSHASAEYNRTETVKRSETVDGNTVEVEVEELFQEKAKLEDQKKAYDLLMEKIDASDVELKETEERYPDLFKANPEVEDVLHKYSLINEMFRKLHATVLTLTAMSNSEYVQGGNLNAEQLEHLNDRIRYLSAMEDFTQALVSYVRDYGQFVDGTYESTTDPLPVMAVGQVSLRDLYEANKKRLTVKVEGEAK